MQKINKRRTDTNQRLSNKKGITLIALIVTIILLLILAGVAIASLKGQNGLIAKLKQAKEKYSIAETKEKLELKITELRLEIEGRGDTLTKEHLPKINSDEIDVGSTESFPVEVICGKYKFNVDENFIVTYVGEADRTIITYTTDPDGYTNQDEIQILIKMTNQNGIKIIEYPNGDIINCNGKTTVGIDYEVTANGVYTFKVIDKENKEVIKDILIDQIDKLAPIDFTPKVEKNGNDITINANADDAEPDGISTKSGIDYFEYYLKSEEETVYTKYDANQITGLLTGTYELYVIAYDRAGNSKKSDMVEIKMMVPFKEISAGENHVLAIDENNNLWSWGENKYGQLGDETNINSIVKTPIQIKSKTKFSQIAAGNEHSLAIDENGNLLAWGSNTYRQTSIVGSRKYKSVAAGNDFSLTIDENGNLWGMGIDDNGQLGINSLGDTKCSSLMQINKGSKFKEISSGINHVLAIDEDNNLWVWGYNKDKQLGIGTKTCGRNNAIKIDNGIKYNKVAAGYDYSLAIDESGNLWGCGQNKYGQLGEKVEESSNVWVILETEKKFKEVSAGKYGHVLLLDTENNLWVCGRNNQGQLGNGINENSSNLIQIKSELKFVSITAGNYYSLAIDENGNTWAWGTNSSGQLGNGTTISSNTPIKIN